MAEKGNTKAGEGNDKSPNIACTPSIFKQSVYSERVDLDKLGWTDCKNDKQLMSYVRGWFWRTYKIRIESPLDFMIHCFVLDALSEARKDDRK